MVTNPNNGTSLGSGNLVISNGQLYFSTCLHVIYSYSFKKFNRVGQIYLRDGTKLIFTGKVVIDSNLFKYPNLATSSSIDYALLEIQNNQSYYHYAANISEKSLHLSQKIRGIFTYYGGSYAEGVVQEKGLENNTFYTSTGGIPGFSGGGFFNKKGKLQGIHRGSGKIYGESTSEAKIHKSVNESIQICRNKIDSASCIDQIVTTLNLALRNPKSEVLDASYLHKLLDKNSKIGIIHNIPYDNIEYELKSTKQWIIKPTSTNSTTNATNVSTNSTKKSTLTNNSTEVQ
jgi:hypothetical protein